MKHLRFILPLAAAGVVLAGCTHPDSSSQSDRAAQWLDQGGRNAIVALDNDTRAVAGDISDLNYTALGDDCRRLTVDTVVGKSLPDLPDGQAQFHWVSALTEYRLVAALCTADRLPDAADLMYAASDLVAVSHRMDALVKSS